MSKLDDFADRIEQRMIDEMAVVLCGVPDLAVDRACMFALQQAGWRGLEIVRYLGRARELARVVRRTEGELWASLR